MSEDVQGVWQIHERQVTTEEVKRARDSAGPDQVVCRECARKLGQITEQHLQTHGMTVDEYQTKYPGAPVYPDDPDRKPGRDQGFRHEEETKRKIAASIKSHHERGVYK